MATGRPVALTFVDTTGASPMAPASPREAAIDAASVARRTRKLAKLGHPAVADNIEILSYRTGALIVADWVEGTSVKAVCESGQTLHTEAVANALAPLAGAMAAARNVDVPLGLDNRQRLRVDTEGKIRLAFPAVLPGSSAVTDAASFASAMELLTANVNSDALEEITRNTRALVDADAIETHDFRDLQAALRREANLPGTVTESVSETDAEAAPDASAALDFAPAAEEPEDDPDALRGGFGAGSFSPVVVALLTAIAVAAVIMIAALTAYLIGTFSSEESDGPVSPVGATTSAPHPTTTEASTLPVVIRPLLAAAVNPDGTPVDGQVHNIVDQDNTTSWTTTRDVAVVLRGGDVTGPFRLEHMLIDAPTDTGPYEIYGLPADFSDGSAGSAQGLTREQWSQFPLLASGTLHKGQNNIDVEAREVSGVVIYLPPREDGTDAGEATLRNVSLIGYMK